MAKARGYANHAATGLLQPFEFKRRIPKDTDVSIDILYCGICHSDIHTARSEWGPTQYPCVPGHEIVGRVTAVGSKVDRFKVGDHVGVGCMVNSCRSCSSCHQNLENYCEKGFVATYDSEDRDGTITMGGYSNKIVVEEHFVLKIPDSLDLAAAAPLLCAGITTYSPLKFAGVGPGHQVAILGLGGLGHMGVKIAAALGAEVTVLSRSAHKRADAEHLGASHFVMTSDSEQVNRYQQQFDFILDTVSAPHDLSQAFSMLKREGQLLMVGASDRPLELSVFPMILQRRSMLGSLIGGIAETQEMLNFCGQHKIHCEIEMIQPEEINTAYERTLKSDVKYRFVIDCQRF